MVSVGIIGLGSYVPPNEMSNEDWMEFVDTSDEWITTKTGMKKRRIASPDVCTSDLAVEACKQALKNANLTIYDNEFFTLLGPSGCGKTTLLRLIAGFEDITEGTIKLFNEEIVNFSEPIHPIIELAFQRFSQST